MTSNFRTLWTLCIIDVYPLIFWAVHMIYEKEQRNKPQTKTSKEKKQIVASIKRNHIIDSFEILF